MALTIYSDIVLPNSILSAGVRGKNIRQNTRSRNQGGFDSINVIWTRTLRQFELGIVPLLLSQWQDLEGLFEATDAGAFGFLMEDPKDHRVTDGYLQAKSGSALLGPAGFGYGVPVYQLGKLYTVAGSTRTRGRSITRPKGPAMRRAGAPVVIGGAPGDAAIDLDKGLVTFVADTAQALASVTTGATTGLNFANGTGIVAALAVGGRVYLSGLTGTAAATLNGLSHLVTAKGASSLTISTVTTGTATAGTAYKYPQPTEALTWSGGFYVPVHFVNDEIDWEMVRSGPSESRLLTGPSVLLQEVRE